MKDKARRRILFVAEAVTLAHVGRLAALASGLDPADWDVCLACDPRYNHLLGAVRYPVRGLTSISGARFFQALAQGSPIYDFATLQKYVEDDRRLLQELRPDVVVGDFRLSLGVSARLEGVPYLNVTNAYWSPYAALKYPVPDIPLVRYAGVALAQRLFDLARPLAFALHALPVNRLRKHYGLAPLPADLRHAYTDADRVLYGDVPELVPMEALPPHHQFLGHIAWSPALPLPDWWASLPDDRPMVYVNLGSSGQVRRLPDILQALADLPLVVVAASAGHDLGGQVPANAWISPYLPGDQVASRAALVVCNGGSPSCYQALAAGRPVVGLAGNLDQYLNMSLVQEAGAGRMLRAASTSISDIRATVRACLEQGDLRSKATELGVAVRSHDAHAALRQVLEGVLAAQDDGRGRPPSMGLGR